MKKWNEVVMDKLENIYNIRKNENLMYILPVNSVLKNEQILISGKIAIAINLYYIDTIDYYMKYINNIPKSIHVYVISSVPEIWDKIEVYKENRNNMFLLKKENRGRDISALLVAFREIAMEYDYICFLHDKKAHHEYLEKDVNIWIYNLWGNTIGTSCYIQNVLNVFRDNQEIGVLVPPEPVGEYMEAWYGDAWAANFSNTRKLAEELGLECDLDEEICPITIGTVFWARVCSIQKLFKKQWSYSDFPSEPMPADGTISHAIERIFAYVAQDAGYKTGTIMSNAYAEWSLLFLQDGIRKMCRLLKKEIGVHELYQMDKEYIDMFAKKITDFFENFREVYIYGAGVFGREMLVRIKRMGLSPAGFVVSDGRRTNKFVDEMPVYELYEVIDRADIGIIVALNYELQELICAELQNRGFNHYIRGNILEEQKLHK